MILLEGAPALSPFRRDRLQARLQAIVPGMRVLGTWHGYWIQPDAGATPDPAALHRCRWPTAPHGSPACGVWSDRWAAATRHRT